MDLSHGEEEKYVLVAERRGGLRQQGGNLQLRTPAGPLGDYLGGLEAERRR